MRLLWYYMRIKYSLFRKEFILKPYQNNKYISIALHALLFLIVAISLVFLFLNLNAIGLFFKKLFGVCDALIYGLFIAYALNPLMKFYEEKVFVPRRKRSKFSRSGRRICSIVSAILSVIVFLVLFIAMIVPQLRTSLRDLIDKLPEYITSLEALAESLSKSNATIGNLVNAGLDYLQDMFSDGDALLEKYLPMLKELLQTVATLFIDIILGFVFAAYFLFAKEYLIAQTKKISMAVLSEKYHKKISYFVSVTEKTFSKYFVTAILDSMLVGFICFLLVKIAGMPYSPLIGVVIGITNIIPVFGPFIGAIPCAIILFVCKPSYAIIFGVMILVIQQIDGNIIVPRIHGASTGLPPVWIIVSITIMSGLFGFIGMFIGVPCFSIIYMTVKQYVETRLERKNFATDTTAYMKEEDRKRFLQEEEPKAPFKERFFGFFKRFKKEKQS